MMIFIVLGMIFLLLLKVIGVFSSSNKQIEVLEDEFSIDFLTKFVKDYFNNVLRTNFYHMRLSKEEYIKQSKRREQLRRSLKTCIYGDINSKNYIKAFIKDILLKECNINQMNIHKIIPFKKNQQLTVATKFDILLHVYQKEYGLNAFETMIREHQLDELKPEGSYYISERDIHQLYDQQIGYLSNFEDQLDILVQRIYQSYKGYSIIDQLRDMKIDGISGGVSGIPTNFFQRLNEKRNLETIAKLPSAYDSIWIFFKGKSIHLRFLSFKTKGELIRVCKNIYKYDHPGQLTETVGYKVNKMQDGSRVVVTRPPFSESWAFFLRKFDSIEKIEMHQLIVDENNELCIDLIKWLVKGCQVTAITGSQGTGKTTLLMAMVAFINPIYNLRIQEMAFELHLRSIYPYRNVLSFKETNDISGQEGLDLQKKTDGSVNILGEVATAPVASWMIQMTQVASLFTLFTHHAKTSDSLVKSLRNNLLQTGVFTNESVAEEQVAEVINFDIHLNKNAKGHRYIARITEIQSREIKAYPTAYQAVPSEEKMEHFFDTMTEYFRRQTNKRQYKTKDIICWEAGKYVVKNKLSNRAFKKIVQALEPKIKEEFIAFARKNALVRYE
jgi:pilus assembly protein CpaF